MSGRIFSSRPVVLVLVTVSVTKERLKIKMDAFKQAAYINKETGKHFANRWPLPVARVRTWTAEDDCKFPKAKSALPVGVVLLAPVEPNAAWCYYVSREEAIRAGFAA